MSLTRSLATQVTLVATGMLLLAVAHLLADTPVGALAGSGALVLACTGYGQAWARAASVRVTWGLGAALGLATLLVLSTALAHVGVLPRAVQIALVTIGITLLPLARPALTTPHTGVQLMVGIGMATLIGMEVVDCVAWISEGFNHTAGIKRLWDTGTLPALRYQFGGQLIGGAYSSLGGGAGLAGIFDSGVCAALLLFLLAHELAARPDRFALPLFLLIATPLVLAPEPAGTNVARWSGVLLHLAMFRALERVPVEPRAVAVVVPLGAALVTLQTSLILLVVPYVLGAFALRRTAALSMKSRLAMVGIAGAVPALVLARPLAVAPAVPLLAASIAGAALLLRLLGSYQLRSPLGVASIAVLMGGLGSDMGVIPPGAVSVLLTPTIWVGGTFAMLTLITETTLRGQGPRLFPLPAALIAGVVLVSSLLSPSFDSRRRERVRNRFTDAVRKLEFATFNGYETGQDEHARKLQDSIPAGETVAAWGVSLGMLDYTRNPIRDITHVGRHEFTPLTAARLEGAEWLIVEDVQPRPQKRLELWGETAPIPPTTRVASLLQIEARAGTTLLYRIVD